MRTAVPARALIAGAVLVALCHAGDARAVPKKSYINTFTLIMDSSKRAMTWTEKHKDDTRLAEAAAAIARANVKTVQDLSPPLEFVDIHPHFVAIIESSLNGLQAVADGDMKSYYKIKTRMKKQRQSLNHVMNEQNFVFPEII
ncbi:MAG: hypothetical protein JRG91_03695 [Deltaproteobacteria bacterium]|nr:hypothetical protein [Deltaproteobacteria bacterium]